jgi:ATP-dependent Clp protease ATP-binding subunit ClpA
MLESLTDQALHVLAHAQDEARSLNHTFVGTEHLLLGLLYSDSGASAVTLQNMGLDLDAVRGEIEKLVQRGSDPSCPGELPLTPRAQRALQFAGEEACLVGQKKASPEHLLLGLFREPDGVAGQVLRNLGLNLEKLRLETLKLRLMQMTIVERIVRPMHASTPRKRKIREELLAHLETIYEQEMARNSDPIAALRAAGQRLGNPSDLTREFEGDLPFNERISYRFEHFFSWRAPQSVARWMSRVATWLFLMMAPVWSLVIVDHVLSSGWDDGACW